MRLRLPSRSDRAGSGPPEDQDGLLDDAPEWVRVLAYALLAAFVPASIIVTLVFAGWLASTASSVSAGTAIATGLLGWLFAHGVPLNLGRGHLGLIPWLLTLLPLFSVRWSAQRLLTPLAALRPRGRPTGWVRGDILAAGLGFCGVYAVVGFFVGALARLPGASAQPLLAAACAFVVAGIGTVWAFSDVFAGQVERVAPRIVDAWYDLVPVWLRRALPSGLRGFVALFVIGALGLVAVTAVSAGRIGSLYADLAPGWVGGAVLTLGQLAYLPTAAAWLLSVVAGPGFTLGGPAVSVGFVHGGALPLIPAFGMVPDPGPLSDWFRAVLALPVVVGAYVGWTAVRRGARLSSWRQRAVAVFGACLLTGMLTTLAFALASGSLGFERLGRLGPDPLAAGAALTGELLLGGLLALAVSGLRVNRLPRGRRFASGSGEPAAPGESGGANRAEASPSDRVDGRATDLPVAPGRAGGAKRSGATRETGKRPTGAKRDPGAPRETEPQGVQARRPRTKGAGRGRSPAKSRGKA